MDISSIPADPAARTPSTGGFRRAAEYILVTILFVLLAMFWHGPAAGAPGDYLYSGDPFLITWILESEMRNIFTDPFHLFDGPAFFPHVNTLAYSDSSLGLLPIHLFFRLVGASPAASYNLLSILAFVLNAVGLHLFMRRALHFSVPASLVPAFIFAFCHYRPEKVHHLHLQWTVFFVFGLWLVYEVFRHKRWPAAMALALVFTWQAYISLYYLVIMGGLLGIAVLFMLRVERETWRALRQLAVAGAVSLILMLPMLLPYMHLRFADGFERHPGEIRSYGAGLQNFLGPSYYSGFPYPAGMRAFSLPERNLFIGIAAGALAIAGAIVVLRRLRAGSGPIAGRLPLYAAGAAAGFPAVLVGIAIAGETDMVRHLATATLAFAVAPFLLIGLLRWRINGLPLEERWGALAIALTMVGMAIACGPMITLDAADLGPGPYLFIAKLPMMEGLRVPARWFTVAILGLAVLSGIGIEAARRRFGTRVALVLALACGVVAFWEYAPLRMPVVPRLADHAKPVHRWLANEQSATSVLELPLPTRLEHETFRLYTQLSHGKKIVNGYSGFFSPEYERLFGRKNDLRTPRGIPILRTVPCDLVVVHLDELTAGEAAAWRAYAEHPPENAVRSVRSIGEALVLGLRWGGRGTAFAMKAPPRVHSLSGILRLEADGAGRDQFVDIEVDGVRSQSLPLTRDPGSFMLDLAGADPAREPHKVSFVSFYRLNRPDRIGGRPVPFHLYLETGGPDPNHCVVGINGRYWPREKGVNGYHLDENGNMVERRSFNTAWHRSAGDELVDWLRRPRPEGHFLILISRHHAAANLGAPARAAIADLGLAAAPNMGERAAFMLVTVTGAEKPILKRVGIGKLLTFRSPGYTPAAGFSVELR